jgi:asparagine synthase (glutamine-hydrolysing)
MPGIFGIVSTTPRANLSDDLVGMSQRLKHHAWYKEDRHVDAENRLALGRVSLGFVNVAEQPATNEDGSLLGLMEGEVYDYPEQRQALAAAGHAFRGNSHAELLLHGYESMGQKFFRGLHGTFAAAIWDVRNRQLILSNDRFGMKGLYFAVLPGRLLFASEIKALLADATLSRQSSPRGIAQFFTFGQLLGEDTLLEAVQLLPSAGWLTYTVDDERVSRERYWRPETRSTSGSARTEKALLDDIDEAFQRAVDRCTRGNEPLGLSLSGGLDARSILGVLDPERPVKTVCLGLEGSLDHHCSEEMARLANRPHHRHILNTRFLARFEEYLRHDVHLTDGHYLCSVIVMPTLPIYRELGIQVLLRGHAGELLHMDKAYNFSLDSDAQTLRGAADLEAWLFRRLKMYTFLEEAGGEALFAPAYRGQIEDLARTSLRACLQESEGVDPPVQRVSHLFLSQRLRRETALSMMEFGSLVETRLPYLDNDLIDLLLATPPELKLGDKIQAHILRRRRPEFLKVVNANTGACMEAGPLRQSFSKLRMRVLAKLGVKGYQPYERLGLWLREDLRLFVQRLLLGERCLERGVFDPAAVKAVVEGHLNQGKNHTYLLLAMMAFELGQRMFIDSDGHAANGRSAPTGEGFSLAAALPLRGSDSWY